MSRRRRNTILAAVEAFRNARGQCSVTQLIAFLYICENEGMNVADLADLVGTTGATASRTASALEAPGQFGGEGLITSNAGAAQGHVRPLSLTPAGAALRDRLDALIAAASPIRNQQHLDATSS